MYESSSKKFRPQLFRDLVGQEFVVTTLKNAIKMEKVATAYLFCGSRGTGKTTLARLLAKTLNCVQSQEEPCNSCPSCQSITQGNSLDVLEIDGASNRGIDDIRQINETVSYLSLNSRYKIYIIDEVHMLTKEAFNALLKTLEEPPSQVKFFFATTEPHKILPTIISRCQRFDLHRLTPTEIACKLSRITNHLGIIVDNETLQRLANIAEGSLRDAESLLDQLICYTEGEIKKGDVLEMLGIVPYSIFFRLDRAIEAYHLPFAFDCVNEIYSSGSDLIPFIEGLIEHYRTILILKLSLPAPKYLSDEEMRGYANAISLYSNEHCLYILDYLIKWSNDINQVPFKRITLEMILLHLIRSQKRVSIPALIHRLENLESNKAPTPAPDLSLDQAIVIESKADEPKTNFSNELNSKKPLPSAPQALFVDKTDKDPAHYPTMVQFAAVELEGTLKLPIPK